MKQQLTRVVCACVCLFASGGTLSAQPISRLVERANLAEFMEKTQTQDNTSVRAALTMGSRVRIRSTAVQGRLKGVVLAVDESVVTLATDGGGPVVIPLTTITALETSPGRRRNWLKGAAIGAGAGLIMGLTAEVETTSYCSFSAAEKADYKADYYFGRTRVVFDTSAYCSRAAAVRDGLITSAIAGAGIGALIKTDRWTAVTLSVAPLARPGQSGFGLAVRF